MATKIVKRTNRLAKKIVEHCSVIEFAHSIMQAMLLRRCQQIASKIAIFLVLFASFAPSISHALAAQSNGSFLQEICSSNGIKKIVIQTITTKGQQLSTVFETKNSQQTPVSSALHLEHCPFCGASALNVAIAPSASWILAFRADAISIDLDYDTPFQPFYLQTAHPSRAPPALT